MDKDERARLRRIRIVVVIFVALFVFGTLVAAVSTLTGQ